VIKQISFVSSGKKFNLLYIFHVILNINLFLKQVRAD